MKNLKKNQKSDSKEKLTLDALKSAAKSITTPEALSKVSGGTQINCHSVGCYGAA